MGGSMTTPTRDDAATGPTTVDRRTFIKTVGLTTSAAAGLAAAAGIEGIVAARRAPAFAQGIVGLQFAYRKSWFDEVGQTSWPKTLDELRQVGMKLKKKGHPIGQTLGHTFGDAPAWAYPLTWGFGGAEVDRSGKKVVLDSKEAVEAVKFMQAFWKDACDEGGFAWDDTSNNRAFLSGE